MRGVLLAVAVLGAVPASLATTVHHAEAAGYASAVLADSPAVYYRLDESGGPTAADSSGHGISGTYQAGVTYGVAGALVGDSDTAVTAPGNGPAVRASDTSLPTGNSARTLEAWVKTAATGNGSIMSYGFLGNVEGESLDIFSGGHQLSVGFGNQGITFTLPYPIGDNRWHHVAVVYDGALHLAGYLDGQVIQTVTIAFGSLNTVTGTGLLIGSGNYNLTGSVDEVAVYPATLGAAQIRAHWQAGVGGACPAAPTTGYAGAVAADGPIRYYRLGETTGRAAADSSGACRDGSYDPDAGHVSGALAGDSDGAVASPSPAAAMMVASDDGLPTGNSARTIEAWFKTTAPALETIVSYGFLDNERGESIDLEPDGRHLIVGVGNAGITFTLPYTVSDNRWHHVAMVYDGALHYSPYIDGQVVYTATATFSLNTQTGYGLYVGVGDYSYTGSVDEVAVYPTALTEAQIDTHWKQGVASACAAVPSSGYGSVVAADHPVRYYRLGEVAGRGAPDYSGNCRNGAYNYDDLRGVGGVTSGDGDGAVAAPTPPTSVAIASDDGLPTGNAARTLEAWVKTPGVASGDVGVVGYGWPGELQGFFINLSSTELIAQFGNGNTHYPLPSNPFDNRWHQVALELDGLGHETAFFDAVQLGTFNFNVATTTGFGLLIGDGGGFGPDLNGSLDEVAVYPTALSQARLNAHYQAVQPSGGAPTDASERGGGDLCYKCLQRELHHAVRVQPIDTANGNMFHTFTDFDIPGRGGGLLMARTYNSNAAETDSGLGFGWVQNNGASLSVSPVPIVAGSVATITEENGSQTVFTYNGTSWNALPRVIATLAHNPDGSWTLVRDKSQTLTFNASGQLASEQDLNGDITSFAYVGGVLTTVTDPAGRTLTFAYSNGHLASVTDVTGRQVRYQYNDGLGNLTDVFDVNGGHWAYGYDAAHHMTSMQDPALKVVTTHYDAQGRADWQTDGNNQKTSFSYLGDETDVTDPRGNVTAYFYASGLKVAETHGLGTAAAATWHYAYDPATLARTAVTDPNGNTTTYGYDAQANLVLVTDPLGRTTQYQYVDARFNEPTQITDGNLVTTTLAYDAHGNLHTASTPLVGTTQTQVVTYNHDDPSHPGDLTSMVDPDGKTWSYGYDADGDLTSTTDPVGDRATASYNSLGWLLSSTAARENVAGCSCPGRYTTTYSYVEGSGVTDEYGDVQTVTDPLGAVTTTTYDADRNVATVTDADHHGTMVSTTYKYDGDNQEVEVDRPNGTAVKTVYWPDESLHQQIDGAGNATSYDYDAAGHLTSASDPLGRTTSYLFDGAGNLLTLTDPQGQVTTFSYDAANQRTGMSYSDGTTPDVTAIQYDGDGQRLSMTDGTGTSTWQYDSLHRLTSSQNGAGARVQYGYTYLSGGVTVYDLKNQVRSLTYPDGHLVTRSYDDAGRWTSVTDWLGRTTQFTPDADSNVTGELYPNQVHAGMAYDNADRLSSITDTLGSTTLASFGYGRDANGQVQTASTTGVPSPDNDTYGYTALNQLASDTNPVNRSYTYDAADNPTRLDGTVQSFDAANQLQTSNTITLVGSTPQGHASPTTLDENVPLPGAAAPGDLVLVATTQPSGITATAPSGYATVANVSSGTPGGHTTVFSKTVAPGDASVDMTYSALSPRSVVLLVYRGPGSSPLDAVGPGAGTSSLATQVTATGVTTTAPGDRLVLFQGATTITAAGTWSVPSAEGMAQVVQQSSNLAASGAADQVLTGPAGPTGSRTTTFTQSGKLDSVLVAITAVARYGFDARGNRTSVTPPAGTGSAVTLSYDQANRLVAYGSTAAYAYDGDGLRMRKTVNGVAEPFTYDVSGALPLIIADGSTEFVDGPGGQAVEQVTAQPAISLVGTRAATNPPTSTAKTLSVPLPNGIQANDRIVLSVTFAQGAANAVSTPPAGYSQIGSTVKSKGTNPNVLIVYGRKAAGNEGGGSVLVTFNGIFASAAVSAVYRGVDPNAPVDVTSPGSSNGLASVAPAATSTRYTADEWLVFQGASYVSTSAESWTAPSGMHEETPAHASSGTISAGLADASAASPGGTGTLTSSLPVSGQLTALFVALKTPPTVLYLHQDQLGSTRMLTDEAGSPQGTFTFDAYGRTVATGGTSTTPLLYAGQYRDAESALYYLRARYYDPATAQFLSRDPAVALTRQPYGYVNDNPLNAVDPTGFDNWAVDRMNDGFGDTFSGYANGDTVLKSAETWLGPNPVEIAPGVWRSTVYPSRQFRMASVDLSGDHGDIGPHCHFESIGSDGRQIVENGHVALEPNASGPGAPAPPEDGGGTGGEGGPASGEAGPGSLGTMETWGPNDGMAHGGGLDMAV